MKSSRKKTNLPRLREQTSSLNVELSGAKVARFESPPRIKPEMRNFATKRRKNVEIVEIVEIFEIVQLALVHSHTDCDSTFTWFNIGANVPFFYRGAINLNLNIK